MNHSVNWRQLLSWFIRILRIISTYYIFIVLLPLLFSFLQEVFKEVSFPFVCKRTLVWTTCHPSLPLQLFLSSMITLLREEISESWRINSFRIFYSVICKLLHLVQTPALMSGSYLTLSILIRNFWNHTTLWESPQCL